MESQFTEKFDLCSHGVAADRQVALRAAFTEGGKIDSEQLKLGETVDAGNERYGMYWPGKAEFFRTIQQPIKATLVQSEEQSVAWNASEIFVRVFLGSKVTQASLKCVLF